MSLDEDIEVIRNKLCVKAYNKMDNLLADIINEDALTYLEVFHIIDLLKLNADMKFTEQALRKVMKQELEKTIKKMEEKEDNSKEMKSYYRCYG